jgi:hypothetical protein
VYAQPSAMTDAAVVEPLWSSVRAVSKAPMVKADERVRRGAVRWSTRPETPMRSPSFLLANP